MNSGVNEGHVFRMVAFNATLSEQGLVQLRNVILARTRKFASKIPEFQNLLPADKDEVRKESSVADPERLDADPDPDLYLFLGDDHQ